MAETPTPQPNSPAPGPLGGLRSFIGRSKGIAAIGPLIGLVCLALIPIVAVTFIALYFAQEDLVRSDFAAGGGNTAGLDLVQSNKTIYVTTYYPGRGGIEGPVFTAVSGDNGALGRYYYRDTSNGEIIDYPKASSDKQVEIMKDAKYELVSVFNQEKTWYARGGLAVNHSITGTSWTEETASPWPITGGDRENQVRNGNTYWLQIPGLDDLVPVIDHFGGATTTNYRAYQRMKDEFKRDMTYRVDFAVKASGDTDPRVQAAKDKMNCKGTVDASVYNCEVKGVNVYRGNRFTASNQGEGDVGPASGPSNEAEGAFTGTFPVIQRRFPAELFGGNKINTYYARPTYIVLHYLAELPNGEPTSVDRSWNYFKVTLSDENGNNNKYVQFIISKGGIITQALAETKRAAGACGFNMTPDGVGVSINIENEGNFEVTESDVTQNGPRFTREQVAALQFTPAQVDANARLVQYLMNKWHIPKSHVISHAEAYQQYGKAKGCNKRSDPGNAFMNAVTSKLTGPQ